MTEKPPTDPKHGCVPECRFTPIGLSPSVYHAEGCDKHDLDLVHAPKPAQGCRCFPTPSAHCPSWDIKLNRCSEEPSAEPEPDQETLKAWAMAADDRDVFSKRCSDQERTIDDLRAIIRGDTEEAVDTLYVHIQRWREESRERLRRRMTGTTELELEGESSLRAKLSEREADIAAYDVAVDKLKAERDAALKRIDELEWWFIQTLETGEIDAEGVWMHAKMRGKLYAARARKEGK